MRERRMTGWIGLFATMIVAMLLSGCTSPTRNETQTSVTISQCDTKDCFISAASACSAASLTAKEDYGTVSFVSYANCTVTKTIVKLGDNETQQMRALLEGKSMTCWHDEGGLDSDLVNTPIFGMENCTGALRDSIELLVPLAID